jgi:hypothetical protein
MTTGSTGRSPAPVAVVLIPSTTPRDVVAVINPAASGAGDGQVDPVVSHGLEIVGG